jgi:hypothetical protein
MDTKKLKKPSHLRKHLKRRWRKNKTTSSKSRPYFKRWQRFNPKYCLPWKFSCLKIHVFCVYLCLLVYDYLIFLHPISNRKTFTTLYMSVRNFWRVNTLHHITNQQSLPYFHEGHDGFPSTGHMHKPKYLAVYS